MGLRFPSIQFNLTPFRCVTRHACLIACLKLPELHSHFFLKYTHIQKSYFYKINILTLIIKKIHFFFAAALLRNGNQLKIILSIKIYSALKQKGIMIIYREEHLESLCVTYFNWRISLFWPLDFKESPLH